MRSAASALSILASVDEDAILGNFWHPDLAKLEATVIPFMRVLKIELIILITMREDQSNVFWVKISDHFLANAQDNVVVL